jgi:transposase-like protein
MKLDIETIEYSKQYIDSVSRELIMKNISDHKIVLSDTISSYNPLINKNKYKETAIARLEFEIKAWENILFVFEKNT